ncbi:hypothetical protein CROQUDRAFT_100230 [Cronartium quercuum f. sp. fusiforme G11]|uniref:Uncharacterized protein n=1 Tax=Cronartium quercuum f. sp. fusiforme G11 TaxID=708437 RepID=A0A9P6N6B0_9BASI|nr:hypothetical protein CROQUDRAFT_100230 [Cronartium quercuum f. sp. fusiforme G11]
MILFTLVPQVLLLIITIQFQFPWAVLGHFKFDPNLKPPVESEAETSLLVHQQHQHSEGEASSPRHHVSGLWPEGLEISGTEGSNQLEKGTSNPSNMEHSLQLQKPKFDLPRDFLRLSLPSQHGDENVSNVHTPPNPALGFSSGTSFAKGPAQNKDQSTPQYSEGSPNHSNMENNLQHHQRLNPGHSGDFLGLGLPRSEGVPISSLSHQQQQQSAGVTSMSGHSLDLWLATLSSYDLAHLRERVRFFEGLKNSGPEGLNQPGKASDFLRLSLPGQHGDDNISNVHTPPNPALGFSSGTSSAKGPTQNKDQSTPQYSEGSPNPSNMGNNLQPHPRPSPGHSGEFLRSVLPRTHSK